VRGEPSGEEFGGHGAAAAIEQDWHRGGATARPTDVDLSVGTPAVLAVKPGEEGVFGFERLILAAQEDGAPLEVLGREGLERVFGGETCADVCERDVHLEGG